MKAPVNKPGVRWFRLMLLAFITNGLGAFGLKVLAERNLTDRYEFQYLLIWYSGWLLFGIAVLVSRPFKPYTREILIAAAMGACSVAGQFFTGLALARDLAGHVAFSISTGGTLFHHEKEEADRPTEGGCSGESGLEGTRHRPSRSSRD
jgi:hypothetical protein